MKNSLVLFLTILSVIFSSFLIAGQQYGEPPILHKEVELKRQSEIKNAREQAILIEEEKQIAKENEEQEKRLAKTRAEQNKRLAIEREKLAKEAELKRLANIEKNEEEAKLKAEEKQENEIKSAVAEKIRQERLAGGQSSSSDVAAARNFLAKLPPACSSSRMSTSADGTVTIRITCDGSAAGVESMDGLIQVKNGVLTKIE